MGRLGGCLLLLSLLVLVACPAAQASLIFPSNITGTSYKGYWARPIGQKTGILVHKTKGDFFLSDLVLISSDSVKGDRFQGSLMMRDGEYSTDDFHTYAMEGVYWPSNGLMLFVALEDKDANSKLLRNLSMSISIGKTISDTTVSFLKDNGVPSLPAGTPPAATPEDCFIKAAFRLIKQTKQTTTAAGATTKSADPIKIVNTVYMVGEITSPNCAALLSAEGATHLPNFYQKGATTYVVMVYIVTFFEFLFLIRQMDFTQTQTSASKVVPLGIGVQGLLDTYFCLIHLIATAIFNQALFYAFGIAAFVYFVKFSLFNMRYLLNVWKARNPAIFNQGNEEIRRQMSLIYMRFYAFLLAGFLLVYYFKGMLVVLVFLSYSLWIPQIVGNAWNDINRALMPHYVIGTSLSRLVVPLYFTIYPGNFVKFAPNYGFAFALTLYVSLQVFVLILQDIKGARFFVPARFVPPKYNYNRDLPADIDENSLDCVVCMSRVAEDISPEADLEEGGARLVQLRSAEGHSHYMIAPCNHVFHSRCLTQWMEFKLECPTCRAPLPLPQESIFRNG